MPLVADTRLLENLHTTADWAAETEPLPDRVQGHEVTSLGVPVGTKIGNGVDLWAALPYWYGGGVVAPFVYNIPAGSNNPTPLSFFGSVDFANGFTWQAEIVIDSVTNRTVNDYYIDKVFTNSSKTVIDSILIYGHDDGTGHTLDAARVTLYP